MLDTIDLTLSLSNAEYHKRITKVRLALREIQPSVRAAKIPVVVVFEGWNAAGKGDSIGNLVYPLDPRGFKVYTTQAANEEERMRPFLWRFWKRLPGRGDFSLFDRSWYRRLLEDRLDADTGDARAGVDAGMIRDFENQLTDDGHVLIKFWLHVSKEERARRLLSIEEDRYERWRITQPDWKLRKKYKPYGRAADQMIELTSTASAPWTLVAATDPHYRRVTVMETVLGALERAVAPRAPARARPSPRPAPRRARSSRTPPARRVRITAPAPILDGVDLSKRLGRTAYEKQCDALQERLRDLGLECYRRRVAVSILYEGWDAAGKGGNIKRLTQKLDPRGYEVVPIAAPDATDAAHHYLWRFWTRIPKAGHIAIFDRSWYGRVLVERVEGFAPESDWRRAYSEINEFERQLTDAGSVVVKFWLHVSPEEQLRRFEERERVPYKRYKITSDDWRNRKRWNDYRAAVEEMLERTDTPHAPWTVVEANDKLWARVRALKTVVAALEARLQKKR